MKRILFMLVLFICISVMATNKSTSISVYAMEEDNYGKEVESRADEKADTAVDGLSGFAENEFNKVMDTSSNITSDAGRKLSVRILKAFYRFYEGIKSTAALMITVSIFIGIMILVICKKNKQHRRIGLFFFIIGFPLLIILIVYGVGILNGIYLKEVGVTFNSTPEYDNLVKNYGLYMPVTKDGLFVSFLNSIKWLHKEITKMSPIIIVIFEALGLIRVFLCKYDERKRNIGLYGYCIGIPVALLLVCFGERFLNAAFI